MPPGKCLPRYRFADLIVDEGRRAVTRGTSDIRLPRLSFELLRTLVEAAPNIVSNDELSRAVWHGVIVGPETVTQRVKLVRDALGDDPEAPRYIAGLRGQGYRVLPPVTVVSETAVTTSATPDTIKGRMRSRLVPIVVGATVLAVALAYAFIDQLLVARHGEASQSVISSGAVVAFKPPPHSIAVLPFANLSGDKEQEYFSDGLSEDLITALSKFPGLKVMGRTSSFRFRDRKEDSQTIGAKLGVAYLLEGSVRRAGNVLRVSTELINAADGSTQWSEQYDRPYKDFFEVQDDITRAVSGVLKARLLSVGPDAAQTDRPPSGNLDAYNALLQGRFYEARDTEADMRKALEQYTAATRLDPRYALAWSSLSRAWVSLGENYLGGAPMVDANAKARAAADTALTLAPDLAAAHMARGFLLQDVELDQRGAEAEFRRAVDLAPTDGEAGFYLAGGLANLGQLNKAIELTRQALLGDPLRANWYNWLAIYYLGARRVDAAERAIGKAIELQPSAQVYHQTLTMIKIQRGDAKAAVGAAHQEPIGIWQDVALAQALQIGDDRAAADAALTTLIDKHADTSAYQIAQVYAIRNDADKTFEWLDRAWNNRDSGVGYLLYDPFILRYKDDPRFAAFCRRVGLPTPAEVRGRT